MKKILYLLVLLTSTLGLSLPVTSFAATVTFSADTTLALPNGNSVTVLSDGLVDGLVVNADSTITLTFGSDTDITIRSNDLPPWGLTFVWANTNLFHPIKFPTDTKHWRRSVLSSPRGLLLLCRRFRGSTKFPI